MNSFFGQQARSSPVSYQTGRRSGLTLRQWPHPTKPTNPRFAAIGCRQKDQSHRQARKELPVRLGNALTLGEQEANVSSFLSLTPSPSARFSTKGGELLSPPAGRLSSLTDRMSSPAASERKEGAANLSVSRPSCSALLDLVHCRSKLNSSESSIGLGCANLQALFHHQLR
jgi:hypothetical protein